MARRVVWGISFIHTFFRLVNILPRATAKLNRYVRQHYRSGKEQTAYINSRKVKVGT